MNYKVDKIEVNVLQSHSTLYIPLAKKMDHGLGKGDTVIVELKGNKLIVTKK